MSDGAPRRPDGWLPPGPPPAGAQGRPELEPLPDEDLSFLCGDWRLFQKRKGHRWSLDDLVTAWVAIEERPDAARALDLGCGLGSVLLLLAFKLPPTAKVAGVEAQADRAEMARRSIAYNGVEARCHVHTGDLREMTSRTSDSVLGPRRPTALATRGHASTGSARTDFALDGSFNQEQLGFELITGTPPYFPEGTGTQSTHTHAAPCRFEHRGGVEDYLQAARGLLTPTGRFVMCASALERGRIATAAAALGLAHTRHLEVIPRVGKPALITVDVFALEISQVCPARAELTVRDATHQWTREFSQLRQQMGLPPTPPRKVTP